MRFPSDQALSGLWKALNAADASPEGGDFDEQALSDVTAAIHWLQREVEDQANKARHKSMMQRRAAAAARQRREAAKAAKS